MTFGYLVQLFIWFLLFLKCNHLKLRKLSSREWTLAAVCDSDDPYRHFFPFYIKLLFSLVQLIDVMLLFIWITAEKNTEVSFRTLPYLLRAPPKRGKKRPKMPASAVEKLFFFVDIEVICYLGVNISIHQSALYTIGTIHYQQLTKHK